MNPRREEANFVEVTSFPKVRDIKEMVVGAGEVDEEGVSSKLFYSSSPLQISYYEKNFSSFPFLQRVSGSTTECFLENDNKLSFFLLKKKSKFV